MMERPSSAMAIMAFTELKLHELDDNSRGRLEATLTALNKHAPVLV